MCEAMPAHRCTAGVEEQVIASSVRSDCEPTLESHPCLLPERKHALAPSFSVYMHAFQVVTEIGAQKADEFRYSQSLSHVVS